MNSTSASQKPIGQQKRLSRGENAQIKKSIQAQLQSKSRSREKAGPYISGFSGISKISKNSKVSQEQAKMNLLKSLIEMPRPSIPENIISQDASSHHNRHKQQIGIAELQQRLRQHQNSQDNLHAGQNGLNMNKRKIRGSRNAAARKSLSQNAAPHNHHQFDIEAKDKPKQCFGPTKQIHGMTSQYHNMLIGDQSLAQITQNSNSNQDAASAAGLTEALQNLNINSNTNSNAQLAIQNFEQTTAQKRHPNRLNNAGQANLGFNQNYNDQNTQSQYDLQKINQIMNLQKVGRNQMRTQQQNSQIRIQKAQNIGITDNPSSAGDQSSSMLTIGLPSVISGGGAPQQLQVHGPITNGVSQQNHQNFNLNMNMNFNIMQKDEPFSNQLAAQNLVKQQLQGRKSQIVGSNKRLPSNRSGEPKTLSNVNVMSQKHGSEKIKQLITAQKGRNDPRQSMSSMKKLADQSQIQNISKNLKNLTFQQNYHSNERVPNTKPIDEHRASNQKLTNLQNSGQSNAQQRRLIPQKVKNQTMIDSNQALLHKKNLRAQKISQTNTNYPKSSSQESNKFHSQNNFESSKKRATVQVANISLKQIMSNQDQLQSLSSTLEQNQQKFKIGGEFSRNAQRQIQNLSQKSQQSNQSRDSLKSRRQIQQRAMQFFQRNNQNQLEAYGAQQDNLISIENQSSSQRKKRTVAENRHQSQTSNTSQYFKDHEEINKLLLQQQQSQVKMPFRLKKAPIQDEYSAKKAITQIDLDQVKANRMQSPVKQESLEKAQRKTIQEYFNNEVSAGSFQSSSQMSHAEGQDSPKKPPEESQEIIDQTIQNFIINQNKSLQREDSKTEERKLNSKTPALNFGGLAQVNSASEEESHDEASDLAKNKSQTKKTQAQQFQSSNPYDLEPQGASKNKVLSNSASQYSEFNVLNIVSSQNASQNHTPQTRTIEKKEEGRYTYGTTNQATRITQFTQNTENKTGTGLPTRVTHHTQLTENKPVPLDLSVMHEFTFDKTKMQNQNQEQSIGQRDPFQKQMSFMTAFQDQEENPYDREAQESKSGSLLINILGQKSSVMKVRDGIDGKFGRQESVDVNSFDQESSSRIDIEENDDGYHNEVDESALQTSQTSVHYVDGHRLDAMESQQFDTNLDLIDRSQPISPRGISSRGNVDTIQTHNSHQRVECEGTEVELDGVNQISSRRNVEDNYVIPELRNQESTEQSGILFDQRSLRNDFQEHSDDDQREEQRNYQNERISQVTITDDEHDENEQFEERDQMQTAIVLQSGQSSSNKTPQIYQSLKQESSSIRKETPAFNEKHKKRSLMNQEIESIALYQNNKERQRENLRTVIIGPAHQSKQSNMDHHQSRQFQISDLQSINQENYSGQNSDGKFGFSQMIERKSQNQKSDPSSLGLYAKIRQNQPNNKKIQTQKANRPLSRNPRFMDHIKSQGAHRASQASENDSLEQRLREEETLQFDEKGGYTQVAFSSVPVDDHNDRRNYDNPLIESHQTIVSKQRVRQVPVSNTPKKLRNISSSKSLVGSKMKGKKNSKDSQQPLINSHFKSGSSKLSMKQDSFKKNVYHIFGRQTSEDPSNSIVSVADNQHVSLLAIEKSNSLTNGQTTIGGNGMSQHANSSDHQKKQRKLLFAQSSNLNNNFKEQINSRGPAHHAHQSVQSFHQHNFKIPVNNHTHSIAHFDQSQHQRNKFKGGHYGNQQQTSIDEQFRTVDAIQMANAKRRERQRQKNNQFLMQQQENMPYGEQMDSDDAYQQDSQRAVVSGMLYIDSEEEHYAQNNYYSQPRNYQKKKQVSEDQSGKQQRRKILSSSNQIKNRKNQKSQYDHIHSSGVLDMNEINQGITYYQGGRGISAGYKNKHESNTLSPNVQRHLLDERLSPGRIFEQQSPTHQIHKKQKRVKKPKNIYHQTQVNFNQQYNQLDPRSRERYQNEQYQLQCLQDQEQQQFRYEQQMVSNFQTIQDKRHNKTIGDNIAFRSIQAHPLNYRQNRDSLMQSPLHRDRNQNKSSQVKQWIQQQKGRNSNISKSLAQKSSASFTKNRLAHNSNEMICHDNMMLSSDRQTHIPNRRYQKKQVINAWNKNQNSIEYNSNENAPLHLQQEQYEDDPDLEAQLQRGRYRQSRTKKLQRVTLSEGPNRFDPNGKIESKVTYRSVERPSEMSMEKKNKDNNLAAWCCLQSKSRAASCETNAAVKADNNSDNMSSVCSIF